MPQCFDNALVAAMGGGANRKNQLFLPQHSTTAPAMNLFAAVFFPAQNN